MHIITNVIIKFTLYCSCRDKDTYIINTLSLSAAIHLLNIWIDSVIPKVILCQKWVLKFNASATRKHENLYVTNKLPAPLPNVLYKLFVFLCD